MNTRIPSSRSTLGWKWSRLLPLLLLSGGVAPLLPQAAYAQVAGAHNVTGKITSATGEPLPGVTVVVKGTTTGVTTDANGNYTVSVPNDQSVFVISSIGYVKQEVAVGARTTFNQQLVAETQDLNEIQVVGYGTQRKSQVTGAISSVTEQQLRDVPVANIGQALQGRAAGVTISSTSTTPGQAPVIRIRGNRSITAGNDPLLVVDGVPYDGSLNDLNPDDITSLEVLKDASATAIYGARGANGVILIVTRRGKNGPARVTYSGYAGIKKIVGRYDLMNGEQFAAYRRQAFLQGGTNPDTSPLFLSQAEKDNLAAGRSYDYQDLVYKTGRIQNHALGMSGGTEQTQYSASLGYYDETGVVPVQLFQRFSLRGTLDQQIGKRVKVGLNTLNTYTNQNDPDLNIMNQVLTVSPLASPFDANGLPILNPVASESALNNPLTNYTEDAHKQQRRRLRTFNSLYGQVNILPGLDYRLNLGLDLRTESYDSYFASGIAANTGQSEARRSQTFAFNFLMEHLLNYNRTFAEKHTVGVTGLYSVQTFNTDNTSTGVRNLPANYQLYYNLGAGSTPLAPSSGEQYWGYQSYMGRLNYAYDNRYSATLTVRVDGSSRLSPGNAYKAFPSAAVAWNIANESFLSDKGYLSALKLRASLGRTGNSAVNPYQTLGGLASGLSPASSGYTNFGTTNYAGVVPGTIPNRNLSWEYTTTTNLGLDFGFLQNRITGSLEVYEQRTSDLILPDALPQASGYSSFVRNIGKSRNRGIELTLSTVNVRTQSGFEWSTDWNYTMNRERIVSLGLAGTDGGEGSDIGNQRFIGQPIYVFYDYKKTGIWQLSEVTEAARYSAKPGDIKLEDVNGDGRIGDADRQIIGSRQPKFEAGLTNRFRFKGFDLSFVAITRVGATIVDPLLVPSNYFTPLDGRRNQINLDYWSPTNPTNAFPSGQFGREQPTNGQTLSYISGTFVKVRSIDLGYNFAGSLLKNIGIANARLYVQVQNPYYWAKESYLRNNKAIDPDALSYSTRFNGSSGNNGGIGFTDGNPGNTNTGAAGRGVNTPAFRSFIVGVNIGL